MDPTQPQPAGRRNRFVRFRHWVQFIFLGVWLGPFGLRLMSIPGAPPPLGDRAKGCRFAPRCPLAIDACRAGAVSLAEVSPGHTARCIRTADVQSMNLESFSLMQREAAHG